MGNPSDILLERVEPFDESNIELVVGKKKRKRCFAKRLLRVALTLAFLWLAFRGLKTLHFKRSCGRDDDVGSAFVQELIEDEDGRFTECAVDSDFPRMRHEQDMSEHDFKYVVETNFSLPLDAASIFFVTRGPKAFGKVSFKVDDSVEDEVFVDTIIKYNYEDHANVCALKRGEHYGVGIFSRPYFGHPRRRRRLPEQVEVDLVVKFPAGSGDILNINALESRLPMFKQDLNTPGVHFGRLALLSSNMPVEAKEVTATHAHVMTSNAPIRGEFNASGSLVLRTHNSPIEVSVFLTDASAGEEHAHGAVLDITTTNGRLKSQVELAVPKDSEEKGEFRVKTTTLNAPLEITFKSSPPSSMLHFHGSTINAPAFATLPAAFEGSFHVGTTIFPASVVDAKPEDPTGGDRARTLSFKHSGGNVADGEVYWGEKGDDTPKGTVHLTTLNSKVELTV